MYMNRAQREQASDELVSTIQGLESILVGVERDPLLGEAVGLLRGSLAMIYMTRDVLEELCQEEMK